MTMDDLILDIINILEVGQPQGNYDEVAFLPGDSGRLSYGITQCSNSSGNLYLLIREYIIRKGQFADEFKDKYLRLLMERDESLDVSKEFSALLKLAAKDEVMKATQDDFQKKRFLNPAKARLSSMGFSLPLTLAIITDSYVHGGFDIVLNRMKKQGASIPKNEKVFCVEYLKARVNWLRSKGGILSQTVYRAATFQALANAGRWNLSGPFKIRGYKWTGGTWVGLPSDVTRESALADGEVLYMQMKGDAVKELQNLLGITTDGIFGKKTREAVIAFQKECGLAEDGIVGPITWRELRVRKDNNANS